MPPFWPTSINEKEGILGKSYKIKLNIVWVEKLDVYLSLWNKIRVNKYFVAFQSCNKMQPKVHF